VAARAAAEPVRRPECDDDHPCDPGYDCVDDFCVPERKPSTVVFVSAGGTVTSTNFVVRVSAGMPQPMGKTSSAKYSVTVGPAAGR